MAITDRHLTQRTTVQGFRLGRIFESDPGNEMTQAVKVLTTFEVNTDWMGELEIFTTYHRHPPMSRTFARVHLCEVGVRSVPQHVRAWHEWTQQHAQAREAWIDQVLSEREPVLLNMMEFALATGILTTSTGISAQAYKMREAEARLIRCCQQWKGATLQRAHHSVQGVEAEQWFEIVILVVPSQYPLPV